MATVLAPSYSDEEIEQLERASLERLRQQPRIQSVRWELEGERLIFAMHNGSEAVVRARTLPGLEAATPTQLSDKKIVSLGTGIHWPQLDVQYSSIALLEVIFGVKSAHSMWSKGGRAKSEAKAATARANGARGGRPKVKAGT